MWEPQMALADHGWRVVAPYLCGMGEGDAAGRDGKSRTCTSIDDFAGQVIDLLDALHVHDSVVCGLSMGGYTAFAMFRLAARYFRGLVLADTRPQADTPQGIEGRKRMLRVVRDNG